MDENERKEEADARDIRDIAVTPAGEWRREIADIQREARKLLGDPPQGEVERFIAERAADWDET
ncbi:MAG: hypothetical protein A4S17_12930 [Proteobacteria bacterium HN_bin10]|nr:MAG: hypothetical protein A4S17_12930 [Proteobacteria bacterium HN_bin10]